MFVVDSNILIYAASERAPEHSRARAVIESWRLQGNPWFITWGILYEFMRVMTHRRATEAPLTSAQACQFIDALNAGGQRILLETDRHWKILSQTLEQFPGLRGSILHDVHTAVLMREHGLRRIYTQDTDLHKLSFLEVIDPLRADWTTAEALAEYGGASVRRRGRRTAQPPALPPPRRRRAPQR